MNTTLDDMIVEKISFLKEQLGAEDDPAYIRTFRTQIKVLQNAQLDRLDELIAIRHIDLKACKNVVDADNVLAELEALQWLHQQTQKHR
jgi:hypothetical protein